MNPEEHGTTAGYQHHRRDGTPVCRACREAHNAYMREYREQRRTPAALVKVTYSSLALLYPTATPEAQQRLRTELGPARFRKLMALTP
ncbi:hypothetical protein ACWEQ4_01510 [Rhodococcus sp. NPDC003994]